MIFCWLFLYLYKVRISLIRSKSSAVYLRNKYGYSTLRTYRSFEDATRRLIKARLDLEFLQLCLLNEVTPNFIRFKLFRSDLYNSDFYKTACFDLLNLEIKNKHKSVSTLETKTAELKAKLKSTVSFCDYAALSSLVSSNTERFRIKVSTIHEAKLHKLHIIKPNMFCANEVIFNFSTYVLSQREKFILSLGLEFCLPFYKPNFCKYFLALEKLSCITKKLPCYGNFNHFINKLSALAHDTFNKLPKVQFGLPFLRKSDFQLLLSLAKNKNLIVSRTDKGKGIVLLNRVDYNAKMHSLLSDTTKFNLVQNKTISSIIFAMLFSKQHF